MLIVRWTFKSIEIVSFLKIQAIKENDRRKIIGKFYNKHIIYGKSYNVKYFESMGMARRTTFDIAKRIEGKSLQRSKGSKRKSRKMTKTKIKNLKDEAVRKIGQSYRKLGRRFKVSHEYIRKIFETIKKRNDQYIF